MIERNQIKDLKPLVDAAKADSAGPKRFAPLFERVSRGQSAVRRGQEVAARGAQGGRSSDRRLALDKRIGDRRAGAFTFRSQVEIDQWPTGCSSRSRLLIHSPI